jgi:glycine cleavage system H protein
MPRPEQCWYTKDHEWVYLEGETAWVGITDFAQRELGDIVYLNLGEAGRRVGAGDEVGEIESVKAVAEFYAPVAGEVIAINTELADHPDRVNKDPLGEGWLIKLRLEDSAAVRGLMDHAAYTAYLETSN